MDDSSIPEEVREFGPGKVVADRYEVINLLGTGGMGFVVKAKDLALNNEIVALKILYRDFAESGDGIFERFKREVILSRRLSHPNIVRVFDIGSAGNNTFYITMEYVEGETLKDKLGKSKPGGIPFNDLCKYLYQIGLGLTYAHSCGIIHRDIKPANMLVSKDGVVKITDFGVAKALNSKDQLTQTGEAVGSPIYMSPEQLNAEKVDSRSDIYGFGIMAYELAAGEPPFYCEHWVMLAKMHFSDPVPDIMEKNESIPFWFKELLEKCLEKDRDYRFQSVKEILQLINEHNAVDYEDKAINWTIPSGSIRKDSLSSAWKLKTVIMAILLVAILLIVVTVVLNR